MSKKAGRADIFRVGAVATTEFQSSLVEVYSACLMSRKHILIGCGAFGNYRTDVEDQQQIRRLSTQTLEDNA
jgi:hypothetical protein